MKKDTHLDKLHGCPISGFFIPNWKIKIRHFKTNKAGAGACRGPGTSFRSTEMVFISLVMSAFNLIPIYFLAYSLGTTY